MSSDDRVALTLEVWFGGVLGPGSKKWPARDCERLMARGLGSLGSHPVNARDLLIYLVLSVS